METAESNAFVEALIKRSIHGPFPEPRPSRGVLEIAAAGIDEYVQGFGLDPYLSLTATGLRVPPFVTLPQNRYLFQLATLRVMQARPVRVRGVKVGINLGTVQETTPGEGEPTVSRVVEFPVTTQGWHPPDGGWAFYLMDIPPMNRWPRMSTDSDSFIYRFAETDSALVYESAAFNAGDVNSFGRPDFYTTLTGYVPPFAGLPLGRPIISPMRDIRYPFDNPTSNDALRIDARSNRTIALYASIQQTDPSTRIALKVPATPTNIQSNGIPPEEAFLLNFPDANIWRVYGSILYEEL